VRFIPTPLGGAFVIEPERHEDERGFFARTWCRAAFESHGLCTSFVQCNTSFNVRRGTLRGLHYQAPPYGEAKLVRCTRGRAFDVMVDLRCPSPTRLQWHAVELSADNGCMVYIPECFAHGFQALEDETELFYQISENHWPAAARGLRFDDPTLAISWPLSDPIVSTRDRSFPLVSVERIAC
jgi:dTDP-4-dehydrorhamnose 3,5-epimerase